MSIKITEMDRGTTGHASLQSRRYITKYKVEGLTCGVDVRNQILPTGTSAGCFPTPGTYPTSMPDGTPLIDAPMRVTDVRVEECLWGSGQAIVVCEMESHIGTFDVSGSFLLDMRISSAIEWVPSNLTINDDGTPDTTDPAEIRFQFPTASTIDTRIAQLSIPRNRLTVNIVQAEPTNFGPGATSHLSLTQYCAFVNSATFWGKPPRTWLCTALEPQWTGFYDKPWHTLYQFVYKEEQWTDVAYFQDQSLNIPMSGITPPANFDPGTESPAPRYGAKVFQIAGEFDFSTLNLANITMAG